MAICSQDCNCESWLSPFVVEWNDDDHSLTITRPKNWTGEVVEWWKAMKKEAVAHDLLG